MFVDLDIVIHIELIKAWLLKFTHSTFALHRCDEVSKKLLASHGIRLRRIKWVLRLWLRINPTFSPIFLHFPLLLFAIIACSNHLDGAKSSLDRFLCYCDLGVSLAAMLNDSSEVHTKGYRCIVAAWKHHTV